MGRLTYGDAIMKNRFNVEDCVFWVSSLGNEYVFRITNIYTDFDANYERTLFHEFVVIYGDSKYVPTNSFQIDSNVYKTGKLLPVNWSDADLLAMML